MGSDLSSQSESDYNFIRIAIAQAQKAALIGEVPIGAVLVSEGGDLLAAAHNQPIAANDPTAHAEIIVLRKAALRMQNYRLLNTTLYVTIEPCIMCMGAIVHARIARLVYGAADPKWGGAGSLYDLPNDSRLNHRIKVAGGVCEIECRDLIQDFFRKKRS